MGLSAGMWTSVSGLMAHGNKMNVVGNNIANVSTVGFKSQRMDFNDYLHISSGSTSGPTQIGAGVATYAMIGDFSQGTLEATNSVTDLAIGGNGFFKVRQPNTEQMYYTRAGDFYFNADRQLQNPEGMRLQGWKVDNSTRLTFKNDSINLGENSANESSFVGTGTPVDIVLDSWYLQAQRTSNVSFTMGLTSDGTGDRSTSSTNPMTALFDQWDASKNPPMADSSYATSSSIKVYDEGGTPHTLTVYYDEVSTNSNNYTIEGLPAGYTMYEYCVTIPPEQDMRTYGGSNYNPDTNMWDGKQPTSFYNPDPDICNKNAGMLMTGHLIFDASGNLVNQSAYTYGGSTNDMGDMNQYDGNPAALDSWQATRFSSNGLPVFTANFTGQPLANTVNETTLNGKSQAQDYIIELDLGLRNLGGKESDWNGVQGASLADLATDTTSRPEKVYTAAPLTGMTYPDDMELYYYDSTSKSYLPIAAKEQNEDGSWTFYKDEAKNDPLDSGTTVYTKDNEPKQVKQNLADVVANIDKLTADKKEDEIPTYYLKDLDTGKLVPATIRRDGEGNTQIYVAELDDHGDPNTDGNGVIQYKTDPIEFGDVYNDGKSKFEASIYHTEDTYTKTTGTPTFPAGTEQYVLYRKPDGTYDQAYRPVTTGEGNDAKTIYVLKDEVNPAGSFYVEGQELNDYTTIKFSSLATFADPQRMETATQAGSSSYITQAASQNGYESGVLSSTNITSDGVVYGYYDNGETVPLYQIALYDFHNKQGLYREGGNLFSATKESGEARQGVPGDNGFGTIEAYNLEGSNVDLSREFVNMITTQRGYQANSKSITTIDTMLETVIGMKR